MVLVQSLAGVFVTLILVSFYKLYQTYHQGQSDYKGILGRLRILLYEFNHIIFYAGEAWWEYYEKLLPFLDKYPNLKIEIIIGRTISHYPDAQNKPSLIDEEGRLLLKNIEEMKRVHPLFRYASDPKYKDRLTVHVKETNNAEEEHFAQGVTSGVSFVESPKSIEPPSGGTIYTDEKSYTKYRKRFDDMIKRTDICRPLFNPDDPNDFEWIRETLSKDRVRFSNSKPYLAENILTGVQPES